jgi:hypothetical protein
LGCPKGFLPSGFGAPQSSDLIAGRNEICGGNRRRIGDFPRKFGVPVRASFLQEKGKKGKSENTGIERDVHGLRVEIRKKCSIEGAKGVVNGATTAGAISSDLPISYLC